VHILSPPCRTGSEWRKVDGAVWGSTGLGRKGCRRGHEARDGRSDRRWELGSEFVNCDTRMIVRAFSQLAKIWIRVSILTAQICIISNDPSQGRRLTTHDSCYFKDGMIKYALFGVRAWLSRAVMTQKGIFDRYCYDCVPNTRCESASASV
jgi:hypothetical protein